MVDVFDDLAVKELTASKMWVPGYKSGDETAPDIEFSGSSAVGGSQVLIGRLSPTTLNSTRVRGRNRTNTAGWVFDPTGNSCLVLNATAVPTNSTSGILLDLTSTTSGVRLPRLTTTERNAIVYSGAGVIIFNTTTNKINIATGSGWEVVTSA